MRSRLLPILPLVMLAALPAAAHTRTLSEPNGVLQRHLSSDVEIEPEIALPPSIADAPDTLPVFTRSQKLASGFFGLAAQPNIQRTRDLGQESRLGDDYMHARYYNPNLGRFLSVDPSNDDSNLSRPQTWNKYAYVQNNPINKVDPDGKAAMLVTAGVGALTGAGFQIGINLVSGDDWDTDVIQEMGIGAALGVTGVGIAKVFDKGYDAYKAAKAAQVTTQAATATTRNAAFELAAQGGKHGGYLREYAQKPAEQIAKAIRGHEGRVAEHLAKLKDPAKYAERWGTMNARERAGLLKLWQKDVNKHREMADVLRGLQ